MTQKELDYIVNAGCYEEDVNTPLIVRTPYSIRLPDSTARAILSDGHAF
jgi:hypothetical protein|eukprot:COSAG01_NODE_3199_length_6426_cov_6.255726_7_plen_49_part_00